MTEIDKVILCGNYAKNVAIARLFNEVSVQKNELKHLGYFITIPKEDSQERSQYEKYSKKGNAYIE